jgi:hypothetical protein
MHPISRQETPNQTHGRLFPSWCASFASRSPLSYCRTTYIVLPITCLLLISGCTKQTGGVIDPYGVPPFVGTARVYPDTVRMKSLPQSNGVLSVSVQVQARLVRQNGSAGVAGVTVDVIASGTTDPFLTVSLHDDGVSPDSVAGDGLYAALVQFTISRSTSGIYRLRVTATDNQGFVSNAFEVPVVMFRDSHAPVLSNLVAPDSAFVPAGGTATIPISIKATDPDGQADINSVYFRSLDSSDPTKQFAMTTASGDSIYSIVVAAPDGPTVRKTYRFAFQAVNNLGDTCASILHRITLY